MVKQKWYKNKWGWYGAVIYSGLIFLFATLYPNLNDIPLYASIILYPTMLIGKIIVSMSGCSGFSCLGTIIFIFPLIPILGFIFGLIAQKIWGRRKRR